MHKSNSLKWSLESNVLDRRAGHFWEESKLINLSLSLENKYQNRNSYFIFRQSDRDFRSYILYTMLYTLSFLKCIYNMRFS